LCFGGPELVSFDFEAISAIQYGVVQRFQTQVKSLVISASDLATSEKLEGVHIDLEQFAHDAYSVHQPYLYLVRPDGYIGFRGPISASTSLMDYLDRFLVSA
jgi:hypothetical protein